jgi:hypothetical protein
MKTRMTQWVLAATLTFCCAMMMLTSCTNDAIGSTDNPVPVDPEPPAPQELADYIADNYPHEIMYYTYEDDDTSNFDEITKEMSPVTLYFLDWGDGGAEIKQFPEIKRKYPCAFE